MAAVYDFKTINAIPIEDVLAFLGILPNAKGWYSIRPEDDTPSAHIDERRRYGNTIHDFGDSNTFNPMQLTMYVYGLDSTLNESWTEAARILGEGFGVAPMFSDKDGQPYDRDKLSDWDWKKIGIQPDMASKNMTFDPEKYGHKRTRAYAESYRMPMNELREKSKTSPADKGVYERILRSCGVAYVFELKNEYFSRLYSRHAVLSQMPDIDNVADIIAQDAEFIEMAKELTAAEDVLMRAIKGTGVKYKPNRKPYSVKEDYHTVVSGEVGFEIGELTQYDIQREAHLGKVKVFDCLVSQSDYSRLVANGLDNVHHAAKQKGDMVRLSFLSADAGRVNYLVRALRGIERDVTEGHDRSNGLADVVLEDEVLEDVVVPSADVGAVEKEGTTEGLTIH